jgi:hypothetical protein
VQWSSDADGRAEAVKTAKQWAAEAVVGPERHDAWTWRSRIAVGDDYVPLEVQEDREDGEKLCDDARSIVERLIERVQTDACASLERRVAELEDALAGSMRQNQEQAEEIARLRAANERLAAEHVEYLSFVADANDLLAEEHEQVRKLGQ